MYSRRRIAVFVEGCLDKALIVWLGRLTGLPINRDNTIMAGGSLAPVRSAIRIVIQWLKNNTGGTALAVIDSDENTKEKIRNALEIVNNELTRERILCKNHDTMVLYDNPRLIEISPRDCEILRKDGAETVENNIRVYLLFWCSLNDNCRSGCVEDVLSNMLLEKYGCSTEINNGLTCKGCPCERFNTLLEKLVVLPLLTACSCEGTLIDIGDYRCALPVSDSLEKLELHTTQYAKSYINALKNLSGSND